VLLTDIDDLRQWLESRPWLDIQQTGTEVLKQLTALDQTPMAADRRAALLELYQPYLKPLTESLERILLDAARPLPPSNHSSAEHLLTLCQQMVSNLRRVLFSPDFLAPNGFRQNDRFSLLFHMSDWLSRLQLYYAQIYQSPGANFWHTVYRIYNLVETSPLFLSDPKAPSKIRSLLAPILLFGAATPEKFRPRELKQIHILLKNYAHLVEFHNQPRKGTNKAIFFFDTKTPAPPTPIKLLGQISPSNTDLTFLFPQHLIKALLTFITAPEPPIETVLPRQQSKKLTVQLTRLFSAPKRRKWRRLREEGTCQLAIGIEQLLSVLIDQGKVSDDLFELLPTRQYSGRTENWFQDDFEILPLENTMASPDDHDQKSETKVFWDLEGSRDKITSQDIWPPEDSADKDPGRTERYPAQLANSSAQGYCLLWFDHTPNVLKVGEIIGIIHTPGELEVGTVRWLKHDTHSSMRLGIELLSFAATGIVTYSHVNEQNEKRGKKGELGLLLPPQPALKKPASLLLSSHSWKTGQWVRVYRDKADYEVYSLKQRIDATPAYDLFSLEKIS